MYWELWTPTAIYAAWDGVQLFMQCILAPTSSYQSSRGWPLFECCRRANTIISLLLCCNGGMVWATMQSKSLLGEKIAFAKLQKELRSQCFADEPNDRKQFQQTELRAGQTVARNAWQALEEAVKDGFQRFYRLFKKKKRLMSQDWMEGQSVLSQRRGMLASVHGIV